MLLILLATAWLVSTDEASAGHRKELFGRDWSSATSGWGLPACRAAGISITARESAARRAEGQSALVVPHAELVVMDPCPVHGRGSRVSNRMLVFTSDPAIRGFLDRHVKGDLLENTTETRIAIDRARPVQLVEIDPYERILSVQEIRPVFLTVIKR